MRRFLRLAPLVVVGLIVIAGIWPKDRRAENQLTWLRPGPGLEFEGDSQGIGEAPVQAAGGALTLELWLAYPAALQSGNREIVSLIDGPGVHRLLVGQFKHGLIFRGRLDNPTGDPRQDSYLDLPPDLEIHHLAVTVDPTGAKLHANGEPTGLELPATIARPGLRFGGKLLLGSSDSGWKSWRGRVFAVAIHGRVLGRGELAQHAAYGSPDPVNGAANAAGTRAAAIARLATGPDIVALYLFEDGAGGRARSEIRDSAALLIPDRVGAALARRVLLAPTNLWNHPYWIPLDLILNIAGFVPLGLVIVWKRGGSSILSALATALVLALGLSLLIEISQIWIPGRSSSLADLICNGLGALLGGVLAVRLGALGDGADRAAGSASASIPPTSSTSSASSASKGGSPADQEP